MRSGAGASFVAMPGLYFGVDRIVSQIGAGNQPMNSFTCDCEAPTISVETDNKNEGDTIAEVICIKRHPDGGCAKKRRANYDALGISKEHPLLVTPSYFEKREDDVKDGCYCGKFVPRTDGDDRCANCGSKLPHGETMPDHPMSEGQTRKVWKIVNGERVPCRVEDLQVWDHYYGDGEDYITVASRCPTRRDDGGWSVFAWTEQEWQDAKDGKINLVIDGVHVDPR